MPSKKSTVYRKCWLISDDVDDARNQARPPGAHKHQCCAEIRKRRRSADEPAVGRLRHGPARLPSSPLPALGRLRDQPHQAFTHGADRERRDGRSDDYPMGQGRYRSTGSAQDRRPGPRHAQHGAARAGNDFREAWRGLRAAGHPGRRRGHLRDALPGRQHWGVPSRVARADVDAASPPATLLLRPGHRGGHRPAQARTGRDGPPVPEPTPRPRARDLPLVGRREGAQAHARRADLPGAGHAGGHARGRLLRRRGRPTAPCHGSMEAQRWPGALPRAHGKEVHRRWRKNWTSTG